MTIVEMCVHMDCPGCESKIKKALKKLPGVDEVDIDMKLQKVTVMGWAEQKKVLKAVRKTGRRAELWPYPYNPEYHAFSRQYANHTNTITSSSSSSYNYYHHGYTFADDFGYYRKPIAASIVSDKAMAIFSDENPHACSIM
ncbi:heavy metal-associated isoprenylated plant protein 28 isoform X1 [Arachis duranensis]|uniref:Heavy metal-associated isoprenylated plant protein 28 isoform X1 n=2 Tax=Arachis duranensis TaxID=130453 RepID=A0A6P4CVM5_ARADU|nr:heavy metal-associated isoprenylated plant protein 28 isoform X1 [Arachis duranensis]